MNSLGEENLKKQSIQITNIKSSYNKIHVKEISSRIPDSDKTECMRSTIM